MDLNLILLDGAVSETSGVSKETQILSKLVKDKSLSLVDRVESFEDIINLEVGDTSFTRARNLEREEGIRQLYLKFHPCFLRELWCCPFICFTTRRYRLYHLHTGELPYRPGAGNGKKRCGGIQTSWHL
jgi:hypothetical protein